MRRSSKYRTGHTVRGCCQGKLHAVQQDDEGDENVIGKQRELCCGGKVLGNRCLGHNYKHVEKCHMCHTGGTLTSLKNVKGHPSRRAWIRTLDDCRRELQNCEQSP